jgi:UDP-2-acetamido-2,6-beta-L-arabino-hexul-4-ose reductase
MINVLITGSKGFLGSNLCLRLSEDHNIQIHEFHRGTPLSELEILVPTADFIIHLAGENKPKNINDFHSTNVNLTKRLCEIINNHNKEIPILFSSTTQATLDNPYGKSKKEAEDILSTFAKDTGNPVAIYRLPGVFGKWCRPNYNSVVATFCFNIANNIDIEIHNPDAKLTLVYIDDVMNLFLQDIKKTITNLTYPEIIHSYDTSVLDLANKIKAFKESRKNLISENVGTGFTRALYATYLSYLNISQISYPLISHQDDRGMFVEMLKTKNSGQFSFFTINSGVTRGQHYHHSKTEKFIVVKGMAKFRFKNLLTKEFSEFTVNSEDLTVVESIPGWAHDISNPSNEETLVMLWANENFNPANPDTIGYSLDEDEDEDE